MSVVWKDDAHRLATSVARINPASRGAWRLGWSVHGVPVFRAKVAGRYIDLLVTSGF